MGQHSNIATTSFWLFRAVKRAQPIVNDTGEKGHLPQLPHLLSALPPVCHTVVHLLRTQVYKDIPPDFQHFRKLVGKSNTMILNSNK